MSEKLSAFLDNELSELEERQVLAELGQDEALKARWERYHLIGAAMRNEIGHVASSSMCEAIRSSIAQESLPKKRSMGAFAKIAGGLAIAASVAAVAILSLQSSPIAPREQSATVTQNQNAVTQNVAMQPNKQIKAADSRKPSIAANPLNTYLAEHSEFAPTAGMGNMLPYVRTVNHEENQ